MANFFLGLEYSFCVYVVVKFTL